MFSKRGQDPSPDLCTNNWRLHSFSSQTRQITWWVHPGVPSYLLPQLKDQRRESIHGRGAQLWALVQRTNDRVNDTGGIVSEIQGLCEAVHCLQGSPTIQVQGEGYLTKAPRDRKDRL